LYAVIDKIVSNQQSVIGSTQELESWLWFVKWSSWAAHTNPGYGTAYFWTCKTFYIHPTSHIYIPKSHYKFNSDVKPSSVDAQVTSSPSSSVVSMHAAW